MSFNDLAVLLYVRPTVKPLKIILPGGSRVHSTHTALQNLIQLLLCARHVDVFSNFIAFLLSTGTLCDSGLTAVYTSTSFPLNCGQLTSVPPIHTMRSFILLSIFLH